MSVVRNSSGRMASCVGMAVSSVGIQELRLRCPSPWHSSRHRVRGSDTQRRCPPLLIDTSPDEPERNAFPGIPGLCPLSIWASADCLFEL